MISTQKNFLYLLVFVAFASCKKSEIKNERSEKQIQSDLRASDDYYVSLIRLIANPEKYENRKIQVIGFLNLQFEGNAIYINESDFETGSTKNAIWVAIPDSIKTRMEKYNEQTVLLEGTFDMIHLGHGQNYGGTIRKITRIDTMERRNTSANSR